MGRYLLSDSQYGFVLKGCPHFYPDFVVITTRINIQTFLVVLTNWMKVLIFIHRKRLGLYQNDFGIDVLKFSTYVPRFCTTFN